MVVRGRGRGWAEGLRVIEPLLCLGLSQNIPVWGKASEGDTKAGRASTASARFVSGCGRYRPPVGSLKAQPRDDSDPFPPNSLSSPTPALKISQGRGTQQYDNSDPLSNSAPQNLPGQGDKTTRRL